MTAIILGPLEEVLAASFVGQGLLHGAVAGLVVGAAQWVHLRSRLAGAGRWVAITVAAALVGEFTGRAVGLVAEAPLNMLALLWTWQILAGVALVRLSASSRWRPPAAG